MAGIRPPDPVKFNNVPIILMESRGHPFGMASVYGCEIEGLQEGAEIA